MLDSSSLEVEEVEEGVDPEEDSGRYMGVLVQALSSLGRVHEAVEVNGRAVWGGGGGGGRVHVALCVDMGSKVL